VTRDSLRWLVPLAAAALVLAIGLAHLASSKPDGLEQVAEQQGFANQEKTTAAAPMPDYEVSALRRFVGRPIARTAAGLAGVLLTLGLVLGVGKLVARRRETRSGDGPDSPDPKDTSAGPNV
jgi:PDGLE domain